MSWLLNLAYLVALVCASPWIVRASFRHGKHRAGFAEKLLGRVPIRNGNRPCVWFHAVSVGEVNLLDTVIDELHVRSSDVEIVISTTTKTGHELACKKYSAHTVFYCPLDFTWATRQAIRRIRPAMLVLAELELWPNLIATARRHGAKVAIINGRVSDKSFRGYRRIRLLTARVLQRIDVIAAQDETTAERFRTLGARPEAVHETGSLKFDGVETNRDNPRTAELRRLAGYVPEEIVFLAGSTQAPEEEIVLSVYLALREQHPHLRLILVPRHPERFDEVAAILEDSGVDWQRRSQWSAGKNRDRSPSPDVLLVDTVGELGAWWGTAAMAFVGGSLGDRGGQNMLEPAAYGAAVCFGPNTRNFRDIVARLLAADAARVVAGADELAEFVDRALTDSVWTENLGKNARDLVVAQQGAATRTVELLIGELECQVPRRDTSCAA